MSASQPISMAAGAGMLDLNRVAASAPRSGPGFAQALADAESRGGNSSRTATAGSPGVSRSPDASSEQALPPSGDSLPADESGLSSQTGNSADLVVEEESSSKGEDAEVGLEEYLAVDGGSDEAIVIEASEQEVVRLTEFQEERDAHIDTLPAGAVTAHPQPGLALNRGAVPGSTATVFASELTSVSQAVTNAAGSSMVQGGVTPSLSVSGEVGIAPQGQPGVDASAVSIEEFLSSGAEQWSERLAGGLGESKAAGEETGLLRGLLDRSLAPSSSSGSLTAAAGLSRPAAESAQLSLAQPFGSPEWGRGVGERVVWMLNQQVGSAELRLDPPELGALSVRVVVQQDQASLSFSSPHAAVRDALEQQLPRLRELLAESGINLDQASVSDQSPSRDSNGSDRYAGKGGPGEEGDPGMASGDSLSELGEQGRSGSLRLVDFYA